MIIALSGFMGCGKTSVGAALSRMTGRPLVDLDDAICTGEGKSVPEIFSELGESGFRGLELKYLKKALSETGDGILALGGGTLLNPECAALVRNRTLCVYLRVDAEELEENLRVSGTALRPLLSGATDLKARIREMLGEREKTYLEYADIIIDTRGLGYGQIAAEILENKKASD